MITKKFRHSNNINEFKKEFIELEKGSVTEKAGFVPAKVRIENLINAGQRLMESRMNAYDFYDDEIDEEFDDPTRRPGYDLADATQEAMAVQNRLNAQKAAAKAAQKEKKEEGTSVPVEPSQNAQEASGEV